MSRWAVPSGSVPSRSRLRGPFLLVELAEKTYWGVGGIGPGDPITLGLGIVTETALDEGLVRLPVERQGVGLAVVEGPGPAMDLVPASQAIGRRDALALPAPDQLRERRERLGHVGHRGLDGLRRVLRLRGRVVGDGEGRTGVGRRPRSRPRRLRVASKSPVKRASGSVGQAWGVSPSTMSKVAASSSSFESSSFAKSTVTDSRAFRSRIPR